MTRQQAVRRLIDTAYWDVRWMGREDELADRQVIHKLVADAFRRADTPAEYELIAECVEVLIEGYTISRKTGKIYTREGGFVR